MSTVYILGAGATKAVYGDAPLTDDLLKSLKDIPSDDYRLVNVRNFIMNFFGITERTLSNENQITVLPAIEDVLNLLDLAIQEQRPLTSHYDIRKLQDIRQNIIYLISNELKNKLEKGPMVKGNIIPNFVRRIEIDKGNSTIISFNYDLLIDNGILDRGLGHVNYGFKVRGLLDGENGFKFTAIEDYRRDIVLAPLYKLHGSANWLYCPTCNAIDLTEGVKAAYYIFEETFDILKTCQICKTKYEPLLITPSMIKRYDNQFLRQIWSSAEESIRKADRLVFIGYSLSNADYYIKYIINRAVALNQNKNNGHLKVLVVTRQNADVGNETEERYCRFFGDKVDFYREGFESYVYSIT
jgi:hypothetical protein